MTRKIQSAAKAGRQGKRSAPRASGAIPVDNVHLDIDQAKLNSNVYPGSPRATHNRRDRFPDVQAEASNPALLRRQDVREAFGEDIKVLNAAIFEQADAGSFEPTQLNADVEFLIGTLSERLTEDSSKAFLREFADLARDPLREDTEPREDRVE